MIYTNIKKCITNTVETAIKNETIKWWSS